MLPAEDRLAATRVVRDLGTIPPDAILYLLAQPLLDLASDHLLRDRDLTARYEERFEVKDSNEWTAALAEYNREADAITAALFVRRGRRGWRTFTSRIGAASTTGWSAVGNTSSASRAGRTPPICGRRASSTEPPSPWHLAAHGDGGEIDPRRRSRAHDSRIVALDHDRQPWQEAFETDRNLYAKRQLQRSRLGASGRWGRYRKPWSAPY